MSVSELFTQRYHARVESGELFEEDLYLHDYRVISEQGRERLWSDAEAENTHVSSEGALRDQIWRVVASANSKHNVKDLLRRSRQRMADAYLQARQPFLGTRPGILTSICETGLDWVFEAAGEAPAEAPFNGRKWSIAANLLVFDFVEVFFDFLPNDEQLEFSRELNTRLQRGASRWYFQLGRWRRDDWPRDRDAQFDLILYSLKKQSEVALERRENANGHASDGLPSDFDPQKASEALETAARALWQADRLLSSDLLSDKVRHNAAVRAARSALDACLSSFGWAVRRSFVQGKPANDKRKRRFLPQGESKSKPKSQLKDVEEPLAAAIRIRQIGDALSTKIAHLPRQERTKLLERANLAEFLMRLALFGLPSDASDPEDADKDEVNRYSRLTAIEGTIGVAGRRYNHGAGTVHLHLQDKATARLAVDLMARLCQYATGAATVGPSDLDASGDLPKLGPLHPRQSDFARAERIRRIVTAIGMMIGIGALVALGFVFGVMVGEDGGLTFLN